MVFPSRVDKDIRFEHKGEEFMFILAGKVEFEATIEGRNKTWILSPGDSAYFDAEIPHRGRSLRGESLLTLWTAEQRGRVSRLLAAALAFSPAWA